MNLSSWSNQSKVNSLYEHESILFLETMKNKNISQSLTIIASQKVYKLGAQKLMVYLLNVCTNYVEASQTKMKLKVSNL